MFPLPFFVTFLSLSFVDAKMHQNPLKSANNLLFLTFHNNSDSLYDVNLVTGEEAEQNSLSLSSQNDRNGSQPDIAFLRQFPMVRESDPRAGALLNLSNSSVTLLTATSHNLSLANGTLAYQIPGLTNGFLRSVPLVPPPPSAYRLNVCVFGDFAANLYEHTQLDLSQLIDQQSCNLTLFIGKIAWERRLEPKLGFNFSPYVMLHSKGHRQRHSAFARVPSIFGATGENLSETTFFQSTEVGDVAFIQITVEIATVAKLADGTMAYDMIAQYFRETMLNELECKLQELHRRQKRPWIVLYMTHPYLVTNDEDKTQWFIMNDTDRFFEILKRYKVDLLTSCGIEGMARILARKRAEMPEAKLPEYIQTTMAQCGGYQSMDVTLQNECSYARLDIQPERISFRKINAENGTTLVEGKIERTFEEADQCVPEKEL